MLRVLDGSRKGLVVRFLHETSLIAKDEALLRSSLNRYPDRIIIGLDVEKGYLRAEGWTSGSQVELIPFCKSLEQLGVGEVIYTV